MGPVLFELNFKIFLEEQIIITFCLVALVFMGYYPLCKKILSCPGTCSVSVSLALDKVKKARNSVDYLWKPLEFMFALFICALNIF